MLCSRHAAGAFPALPSVCWAALLSWLHHLSWSSFRAWQKPPQAQSPPNTQHPVLVLQVLLFCFGCPLELKLSFPNEWQKKSLGPGVLGASSERGDLGLFGHWLKPISGCTGAERRGSHQCSMSPSQSKASTELPGWATCRNYLWPHVLPGRAPPLSYTESLRSLAS